MLEWSVNFITALGSLGVLAGLGYVLRYYWHRWRWSTFVSLVEQFARDEFIADTVTDDELRQLVVMWLVEAEYTPRECMELLDFAALFARARIEYIIRKEV